MFKQTSSKQSLIEVHGKLIKEAPMVLIMEFRQLETATKLKNIFIDLTIKMFVFCFRLVDGML
jgi:hypothetical protein